MKNSNYNVNDMTESDIIEKELRDQLKQVTSCINRRLFYSANANLRYALKSLNKLTEVLEKNEEKLYKND